MDVMKKNSVVAVVVTYNPDIELLKKNIYSYISSVEKIIVCNNSLFLLQEKLDWDTSILEKIEILNFMENKGIAQAQSIGMEKAMEYNPGFILQMDQDSVILENGVQKLVDSFLELRKNGINVGLLGPVQKEFGNEISYSTQRKKKRLFKLGNQSYRKVKALISSGSLICVETYKKTGGMMDILFIDHVDTEYCWRIKENGFEVIQALDIFMMHQLGNGFVEYKGEKYLISSPIREYYQIRNSLYLIFNHSKTPFIWKKNELKLIIKRLLRKNVYKDEEIRKKYRKQAIKDWFRGKMGRIDED